MEKQTIFKSLMIVLGISVVILGLYVFTGNIGEAPEEREKVLAPVSDVSVEILESFPVQVRVVVSGSLTCGNSTLGDVEIEKQDNKFVVHLYELVPTGNVCLENLVSFEKSIPLDVYGLPAGEYTVSVHGISSTFVLDIDLLLEEDASETEALLYKGEILAGEVAPLIDFNGFDYTEALASDKIIFLYFYAKWCPSCKAEMRDATIPAFEKYAGDAVVGFRVNYNDSNTDKLEELLAEEFGVLYQHTKVFIKNGELIHIFPNIWTEENYLNYFESLPQQL